MQAKPVCELATKFDSYPPALRARLLALRTLVLSVAAESAQIADVVESLKWGEPSYAVKGGSPVRLCSHAKRPEHYALFFNCNTKLVDTFKELYRDKLQFDGNRAIVFHLNDDVPQHAVKHCIALALRYHKVKHLPLLGA
mgnify:CR=1 FL=1